MESQTEPQIEIDDKRVAKSRTKKSRIQMTKTEKAKLWEILDMDTTKKKITIENDTATTICKLCDSSLVSREDGFPTCINVSCGLICRDVVDFSPEWRFYGADDKSSTDPTRCGNPINPLLQESSLGCKVLYSGNSSYEMRKIGKWTEWQSIPHREKSLYSEFTYISNMAQNAGIPKIIVDSALAIHKDISEQKMFRGCNRDGIKAASIYIACKIHNYPRTAKEIATIFHLDVTAATKGCKNAVLIINDIEKDLHNTEKTAYCKIKPEAFIERYCSKLNINAELTKLCQFIAIKIEKNGMIPENTPQSIAAGVVYFIIQLCKLNVSKKDVKNISEISEVTINKCYKKIEKLKGDLIPESLLKKYGGN